MSFEKPRELFLKYYLTKLQENLANTVQTVFKNEGGCTKH